MTRDPNRNDLGDFLKARRSELSPADVGLSADGQARRVAGLRREEVADAGRDQHRLLHPPRTGPHLRLLSVLASLSQVLRLDDDQRAYLYELADRRGHYPAPRPAGAQTDPQLQRMLDDMAHTPAFVIGPRTEIVAWNAMGAAMITDFGKIPGDQRYYIRMLFTDPAMRSSTRTGKA